MPDKGSTKLIFPECVHTGLACMPFGLFEREIHERRVDALPIVVALDVAEQIPPSLFAGYSTLLMNETSAGTLPLGGHDHGDDRQFGA